MSGGLRVAMLTPVFWPEVRRGTERTVHELCSGLIARGHEPLVITSHHGKLSRGSEEGVPVLRVPRPPDERLRRRAFEDYLTHVPLSYAALRKERPDVAHAWFQTDALAAIRYGRKTGRPVVHSYMGVPNHTGLMWRRRRLQITQRALAGADVTVALSRYAAREFERWLDFKPRVIPPPVDVDTFRPTAERTPEPTVVCAAVANTVEPRKRLDLLLRAWPLVLRDRPTARLILDRPREWFSPGENHSRGLVTEDMSDRRERARWYSSAWASVLPSEGEAFGLVLAEALACGTPGVGSNLAGIPEVIGSDAVGRLFDGDEPEALAKALLEAFELAQDPGTRTACREHVMQFSRAAVTDAYEQLYRELL